MTKLEELIATGYKQPTPPKDLTASLPYLKGRATIDWELKRPDGKFDVEGKLYDKLQLTTVVDGFTAPITAGNFVELVNTGFYDGFKVQRSDGFVVQARPVRPSAPPPTVVQTRQANSCDAAPSIRPSVADPLLVRRAAASCRRATRRSRGAPRRTATCRRAKARCAAATSPPEAASNGWRRRRAPRRLGCRRLLQALAATWLLLLA